MSANIPSVGLCAAVLVCYSTVTMCQVTQDTVRLDRCEDLVVTSGEDIVPGEAGKLVGPGRNKRTRGFG